MYKRVFCVDKT